MIGLDPGAFDAMLNDLGQDVLWRRGTACPCRDPFSGAARQGCPNCQGRGTFWAEPVRCRTALAGLKASKEWAAFGMWQSGDVVLTIPSDSALYGCGDSDRITLVQSTLPFSTVLTRGDDRLTHTVAELTSCIWLQPGDSSLVRGDLPTVDADGAVDWPSGAAQPDPGQQYTLTGRRHPEMFILKDLPQDRAHMGGRTLPRRVAARTFDLFGR